MSVRNLRQKPWPLMAQKFSNLLATKTLSALKDSFGKIDDTLFNLSQSSSSGNDHFDSLRVIRNSKSKMFDSWSEFVEKSCNKWSKEKVVVDGDYELSLVSVTELEAKLATDQMAESFYKNNLSSFDALIDIFKEIADQGNISGDLSSAPLHHLGFASTISEWMATLELGIESQLVVMKILEKEVNKSLPGVLSAMIEFFEDNGWVAKTPPKPTRNPLPQPPAQDYDNEVFDDVPVDDSGWEGLDQVEQFDGSVPSMPPTQVGPSSNHHVHVNHPAPPVYQAPQRNFQPYFPEYAPSSHDVKSIKNASYLLHALLEGQEVDDVEVSDEQISQWGQSSEFSSIPDNEFDPTVIELVNFLKSKKNKKQSSASNANFDASSVMSQDQVRSVLNNMQKSLPQSVKVAARENNQSLTDQFKEEILSRAVELGIATDKSKLNDQHEDAIDIVGMLFEIFLSERQIVADMREHIARLVAPYVKVAIMDKKMFMHKSHPARRFLDVLAEACEGNDGASSQEKKTLDMVGESIDTLVADFNEDVAIFELAESEIREFINQQRLAVELSEKRASEAQKGKERLAQAREKSSELFISLTQDCNWPVKTHELLKKYWSQHHSITLLRHEDDDMKIKSSEYILKTLVKMGMGGISNIGSESSNVHGYILNMLASNGIVEQNAEEVAVEIWSALEQASRWQLLADKGQLSDDVAQKHEIQKHAVIEKENISRQTQKDKEEKQKEEKEIFSYVENKKKEDPKENIRISDYFNSRQEIVEYFEKMESGTWIDFVKPDSSTVAVKLSWVSPISKRLLFVTQRGLKHAVESPQDLAVMVILGKVRLRKMGLGEDGFERSLKKAVETLSNKSPSPPSQEEDDKIRGQAV